jgi:hypothetical protein
MSPRLAVALLVLRAAASSAEPAEAADPFVGRVGSVSLSNQTVSDHQRPFRRVDEVTFRGTGGSARLVESHGQGHTFQVRLGEQLGTFTFKLDGDAVVVEGAWAQPRTERVVMRVDRHRLDFTWGDRERHLAQLEAPQLGVGCLHFAQTSPSVETDQLDLCGAVLTPSTPPLQTVLALLMQGPDRDRPKPYLFRSRNPPKDPPPQDPRPPLGGPDRTR